LTLNPTLESMAQDAIPRTNDDRTFGVANMAPNASRYNGQIRYFSGYGDRQSESLTDAYKNGAGGQLNVCEYTEFGSGFHRNEEGENSAVIIIFGKPAAAPAPAAPVEAAAPVAPPPTNCPPGSKTATVDPPARCEGPTNAVTMNITKEGINANAAITNNSALPADCAYTATKTAGLIGPGSVNRSASVGPNSTESITDLLWPLPPGHLPRDGDVHGHIRRQADNDR
jgi:hypothetical protein